MAGIITSISHQIQTPAVAFQNPTKEQIPAFQTHPVLSATQAILRRPIVQNILEWVVMPRLKLVLK